MVLLDFCPDFRKIAHEPPVIRASGARCDITRLVPAAGAGACCPCKEARVQKATVPQRSPTGAEGADRLRQLVLVRMACALRGATKAEIATDLAPIATDLPAAQWRAKVDREIEAMRTQGLASAKSARLDVSDAGKAQVARFLGVKGDFPRVWSELRDIRLVAVALGMQREPAKRLKALATVDGLRGAIVESAYNLKVKRGVATPARLREALAAMALKRAFGDKGTAGLAGKLGLSAKASRTLAAQLAREPRDFGTDTRLIAALAAEHLDTAASDIGGLRVAVLRRYFGAGSPKTGPARRKPSKRALGKSVQPKIEPVAAPVVAAVERAPAPAASVSLSATAQASLPLGRPDLPGFASEVRRHAASQARGWSGDRKAYISHVWRNIREKRPDWGLSEIEFKCMLAEAHRAGQLALANADLKDKDNIKDVQDSAVSYRNAVFHFIRVDA
jgi:hypothetical protein